MKLATLDKISVFLAEFMGTGILVFLGCMGCVHISESQPHLNIALNFGLAVMLIVNIFGQISGAHLNPAVTVAAVLYKMTPITMVPIYVTAQLLGGFLGFGVLKLLTPQEFGAHDNYAGLCTTVPHPTVSVTQAFFVEFIITGILVLICCGVWDPRNANHHDSVPLRFGLAITCLAIAAGPYSGGSMNPARSFAPALWNNNFTNHWIYWVAPLSAAFIFAPMYKAVFWRDVPQKKPQIEEFPLARNEKSLP